VPVAKWRMYVPSECGAGPLTPSPMDLHGKETVLATRVW
jgi:hypothetical protein